MKYLLRLDGDLLKIVKVISAQKGISMREFIQEAVKEYLDKQEKQN
jgi:metal-responsive CopG/Arc/MetJ family transcriptional regulator